MAPLNRIWETLRYGYLPLRGVGRHLSLKSLRPLAFAEAYAGAASPAKAVNALATSPGAKPYPLRSTHSVSSITLVETKTSSELIRALAVWRLLAVVARQITQLSRYQSRAYRRLAAAATPASISSSVFGGPATLGDPNTSSGRVRLKIGAALNTTPSGVSSTIRRVPTSQCRRCRIDLGRITCALLSVYL